MKNKILTAFIFLSILVSGCSSDNSPSTNTTTPPPQTSTEPKTSTVADNGEPLKSEQEAKKNSDTDGTGDGPQDDITQKQPDPEETPSKINNTGDNPDDTPTKTGTDSAGVVEENTAPADNPDDTKTKTGTDSADKKNSPEPIPMPSPQKPESFLDGIDMFTAGIIVVLVAVLAILIWLVYDRNKMRRKINNLNNSPLTPNPAPQKINPAPQTPATVTATAPTAPPPVNKPLSIRVDNLQHIGSRQEQQDSFCLSNIGDKKAIREKGLMAVVADGMGGLEGGAIISRLVTDTFLNSYNDQFNFEPASFLYNTAESAEFTVEDYIKQSGVNGGSTLVAVIIKNSQMNYISVGDSHIYLLRDNTLTMINKEHSFGALLKEKADRGEVDPREPYVNPKRNSLTAYIGMGSFNIVDRNANPISLKVGDKILLCSDGVYNALGDDALIAALAGDASNAAKKIQATILEQNIPSQDNFTAIILECVSD